MQRLLCDWFAWDPPNRILTKKYLQKDKYKDKDTHTQTNTKCFQDPMYAIFFKSRGFKDIKYCISSKNSPLLDNGRPDNVHSLAPPAQP